MCIVCCVFLSSVGCIQLIVKYCNTLSFAHSSCVCSRITLARFVIVVFVKPERWNWCNMHFFRCFFFPSFCTIWVYHTSYLRNWSFASSPMKYSRYSMLLLLFLHLHTTKLWEFRWNRRKMKSKWISFNLRCYVPLFYNSISSNLCAVYSLH